MPLIKSSSPKAVGENISREVAAGKPRRQAIAIALDVQRRAKMAAGGKIDTPFYARSGARSLERAGMIHSPVAGRTDALPISVRQKGYIVPADVVSGIGQGNSLAGANGLNKMLKQAPFGASMPHPSAPGAMKIPTAGMMKGRRGFADGGMPEAEGAKPVDIMAAGGEYVISPDQVAAIGGGDIARGHEVLDAFVKHVRKKTIKTLRKLPAPKKS